jgi:peptide subunit release factor RF-3
MAYRVVALTMMQVRQGALQFQRDLADALRESKGIKVYSASPFDLDERRRLKDRFGGDIVYFFNEGAYQECVRLNLDVRFIAEVPDDELPRRRALFVGIPD